METLNKISLKNVTVFESLEMKFSPGINIFIGKNGTGKTHLLKILYAAGAITNTDDGFADKLIRLFLPHEKKIGRLVRRKKGSSNAEIEIFSDIAELSATFSNHTSNASGVDITGQTQWKSRKIQCAYIPVKEMLANAPGFRSLYAAREINFEEIYADIIDRAYLPIRRGPLDENRSKLLNILEKSLDGKVITKGETFFLKNKQGELEFTLLAEGMRKLALLWILIQNGTLLNGSVLFWDEPESNLNPFLIRIIVQVLLELQRFGVQVFIATHDYVVLKEFDLQRQATDNLSFHSFYRAGGASEKVEVQSSADYRSLIENSISDTFLDLFDREVQKIAGGQ